LRFVLRPFTRAASRSRFEMTCDSVSRFLVLLIFVRVFTPQTSRGLASTRAVEKRSIFDSLPRLSPLHCFSSLFFVSLRHWFSSRHVLVLALLSFKSRHTRRVLPGAVPPPSFFLPRNTVPLISFECCCSPSCRLTFFSLLLRFLDGISINGPI